MNPYKIPQTEREWSDFFGDWHERSVQLLCRDYSFDQDDAEDIVQDSFMALYCNIRDGKLLNLTSKLSTYFTRICIFQALKSHRDNKECTPMDDNVRYDAEKLDELIGPEEEQSAARQEKMERLVTHLPEPCNKILWSFYYENMTMTEIARVAELKNADTAKSKKSQCMSRLKETYGNMIKDLMYER